MSGDNNAGRAILAVARADLGVWEWAGAEHNPKVLAYYDDAGFPEIGNDEVPWCAAFANAVLKRAGYEGTGSLLARSFADWGVDVPSVDRAQPGDVVVIPRGSKSWQGHVFFIDEVLANGRVMGLGGNQGDQVNIKPFDLSNPDKVVAIRRAPKPAREAMRSSTTLQASGAGAAATCTAGLTAISQLEGNTQLVAIVCTAVVLLAFMWIARERIRKWIEGDR